MNPETGRRFGPYEIQARLGGGGMGAVYRAWDARLHREVAIKLLHNEYAVPDMRERFLREARAASALNHPNICTIFDIGEQDGEPYLVMELLEGETLKDRILRSTIQVEDIISIARDVAEGLAAAHAKGIVHRDVKPANIFLVGKPNGKVQAKVLDFGLAKIEGGPLGARGRHLEITSAGATVGTLAYMSPEQARGEVLDQRSDLFSFGVVLYEMATKQTPFQGATSALVFVKLLNHPPEPVREWNDAIPRDLEKIILKLMAKERTARYQTAGELEQALLDLHEKPAGGGWLRKAIATVPLVRAPDPVVRERRVGTRKNSDSQIEPDRQAGDPPHPPNHPGTTSTGERQFLRPITRLPREDATPRSSSPGHSTLESSSKPSSPNSSGFSSPTEVPASRPVRERYHPDHDELFDRPSRRAAAPRPSPSSSTPIANALDSSARSAIAVESASRQIPFAHPAPPESGISAPTAYVSNLPWVEPLELNAAAEPPAGAAAEADQLSIGEPPPFLDKGHIPPHRAAQLAESRRHSLRWLASGLLLAAGAIVAIVISNRGHFGAALLTEHDQVVLTVIENHTSDTLLDGSVAQGLQMALAQSPYLNLASGSAFPSALHMGQNDIAVQDDAGMNPIRARVAAQRLGAKAYLYGRIVTGTLPDATTLRSAAAAYTLHVDLMSTSTNDVLASLEERAVSLQQIPGAIDRLADDIRASAGEDTDSIGRSHNALTREATGSLEALHAYAQGEDALASGRTLDALGFYQKAVTLDPRFVQAYLKLVVLYRKQRAEVAAADSARLALSSSDTTSERTRTLAQYEYEMNASGDYTRATALIKRLVSERPHDSQALSDLGRVLRLEGRLTDALQMAQQATAEDAFNLDAYVQTSSALIGLDRYDAALQIEQQTQRLGLSRVGGTLIGSYLEDRQDGVDRAVAEYKSAKPGHRADWNFGLYLDNSGRLTEGLALWRTSAATMEKTKGLESSAAYLLSQGALDRALVGACGDALDLARESAQRPQGLMALFNSGMSGALCGDRTLAKNAIDDLRSRFPQSTDADEYLIADLRAALALNANDPATALEELRPSREYDLISLTPYLRGRAHVMLRQIQIGIVDFQTVLSHRGITFIVGTDVYPVAEIGVARAFADTGDFDNSSAAYRQFLVLWKNADAGQPLLGEARTNSK